MDNPEQYLLQVIRRTQTGLQDSLIPFHAGKMQQLAQKLEQASALKDEIRRLQAVNGFTKAALSMQWIMGRVERSGEDFTPDQFDADATILGDKLFEAFLSEPFDVPVEVSGATAEPVAEEVAGAIAEEPQKIQSESAPLAGDLIEVLPHSEPQLQAKGEPQPETQPELQLQNESKLQPEAQPEPQVEIDSQPEPQTDSQLRADHDAQPESQAEIQPQPEPEPAPPPAPPLEEAPALTDLLDQNLLLGFQRFTEIVSKLGEKTPAERKSVFAVLAMIAKSSTDVARAQGKKDVLDFFQSVIKFITYVDTSGSTQNARVTEIMREVGERLSKALKERSNGPALLQSINQILQNPEGSLKS